MEIIDLLEKKPFSALSKVEMTLVLESMTQSEYESLYLVYQSGIDYFQEGEAIEPSSKIGASLNATFQHKQAQKHSLLFAQKIPFWQAAAILLVGWACGAWVLSNRQTEQQNVVYIPVHDTLSQLITQIDTVIEYVNGETETVSKPAHIAHYVITTPKAEEFYQQIPQESVAFQTSPPIPQDVHTIRPEEVESILHNQGGKTRSEDSLLRKFGFVTM